MSYDTILEGGTVVDGSGAAPVKADLAISGDRIAAIGDLSGAQAGERINCSGLAVSPGFIDIHTHYDPQILWDPDLTPTSWFGVTTIFLGNCGFTIAPMRPEGRDACIATLGNVEAMSVEALKAGISWEFETFKEYLEAIGRRKVGLNVASLVGHTALRMYALPDDPNRAATDDEIRVMQKEIEAAMSAGAWGFSTSKSPAQVGVGGRPVPSRMSTIEEIGALADVLAGAGAGILQGVGGPGLGVPQFADLARRSKRPVTWCSLHQGVDQGRHWEYSRQTAQMRSEGADIWAQMACAPIIGQFTLASPYVLNSVPCVGKIANLPQAERLKFLTDPAWQKEAERQFEANAEQRTYDIRFDRILVADSAKYPELVGKTIADITPPGKSPLGFMVDLARSEDMKTRFKLIMFNYDDNDVAKLLQQPSTILGLGDGGAHTSQLCDSSYPLHLLGHFVRERKDFPLEFGVWRLTGHPAQVYGIKERGLLKTGYFADICVFNPDTVDEGPLKRVYDQPAGAERLIKEPIGVEHVLVNGGFIRRAGVSHSGVASGRLLRP
jgi:N-acyl-D-amino-acid deacylase